MKVNKRKFIIIVFAILIVVVISSIIGFVIPKIQLNQIKSELGEIKSKELETKIIEELEKTSININTQAEHTVFGTYNELENNTENQTLEVCISGMGLYYEMSEEENPYINYISAYITKEYTSDEESFGIVVVPCFKIESDDNGNFKSIKYINNRLNTNMEDIIFKVLKDEYNINIKQKYKTELSHNDKDKIEIYSNNNEVLIDVTNKIQSRVYTNEDIENIKQDSFMETFGI